MARLTVAIDRTRLIAISSRPLRVNRISFDVPITHAYSIDGSAMSQTIVTRRHAVGWMIRLHRAAVSAIGPTTVAAVMTAADAACNDRTIATVIANDANVSSTNDVSNFVSRNNANVSCLNHVNSVVSRHDAKRYNHNEHCHLRNNHNQHCHPRNQLVRLAL